jgi:hypothetical protein
VVGDQLRVPLVDQSAHAGAEFGVLGGSVVRGRR